MSDGNEQGMTRRDLAEWLVRVVRELKELGIDPPLVRLADDGVTDTGMTLTDELFLIAVSIDYGGAMSVPLTDERDHR